MALYEMKEMPDINKTGERILYPRLAMVAQTSTEELVREIASGSSFTPGNVQGLLVQLYVEIAHQLAQGRSVKLDGIGVFTASLALAVKYLEEHPYLTVADYRRLTGLLHTTAANELRQWAKQPESRIDTSGRATHRVYVLRQEVRSTGDE